MEMTGEQLIALPQQQTWEALNDTAVLKDCIPGCETIEKLSDSEYEITLTAKVGPVSAKFKGRMTVSDVVPPVSYTITFEGQGGIAGFAKGAAQVRLEPQDGGTRLAYSAQAMVGGKLAQVGARLIDGVAKKLAEQFFREFNKRASGASG